MKPYLKVGNKSWCYPALVIDMGAVHNTGWYTVFYFKLVVWKFEINTGLQIGREL